MKLALIAVLLATSCSLALSQDLVKDRVVLSTGIDMSYVTAGPDDGRVVILLHGYTDTSRSLYATLNELHRLDPGLKVYALDLRGHGNTSMPSPVHCATDPQHCFEPARFAEDVIAFMDTRGITAAHIVGHSMGSVVAQELALEFPARVHSLILIGSFLSGQDNAFIQDYLVNGVVMGQWQAALAANPEFNWPQDAYLMSPADLDQELTAWIHTEWVADPTADDALLSAIYAETMATRLGTWIGVISALAVMNNTHRMATLSVDTLVLWATQDNAFGVQDQQALIAALTGAAEANDIQFVFKPYGKRPLPASGMQENDLGHNLQWSAYAAVAADIQAFIQKREVTQWLTYADEADPRKIRQERAEQMGQSPFH